MLPRKKHPPNKLAEHDHVIVEYMGKINDEVFNFTQIDIRHYNSKTVCPHHFEIGIELIFHKFHIHRQDNMKF